MSFKKGDKVLVIAGSNKGKEGVITEVLKTQNRVIIEGVNMVKKHVKPQGQNSGSIVEKENGIHISNVMILDSKTKTATRTGHTTNKDGKKVRVTKKSNEILN